MKIADIKYNDVVNGEGICVSFWTQGCPHKCPGCHNPQTWDKDGGKEAPTELIGEISKAISANGIERNLSILGGEPLAEWNISLVKNVVTKIRMAYPLIKIYLWTGYTMREVQEMSLENEDLQIILDKIDVLIDGRFIRQERDITLKMRGSSNQNIWRKNNGKWSIDND